MTLRNTAARAQRDAKNLPRSVIIGPAQPVVEIAKAKKTKAIKKPRTPKTTYVCPVDGCLKTASAGQISKHVKKDHPLFKRQWGGHNKGSPKSTIVRPRGRPKKRELSSERDPREESKDGKYAPAEPTPKPEVSSSCFSLLCSSAGVRRQFSVYEETPYNNPLQEEFAARDRELESPADFSSSSGRVNHDKKKLGEDVWLAVKLLSVGTDAQRERFAGKAGFLSLKRDFTSSEDTLAEHGEDELVPMEEPSFISGDAGFSSPDQTIHFAAPSVTETESEAPHQENPGVSEPKEVTFYGESFGGDGDSFGDNTYVQLPRSRAPALLDLLNEGLDVASVLAQAGGYSGGESGESELSVRSDVSQI